MLLMRKTRVQLKSMDKIEMVQVLGVDGNALQLSRLFWGLQYEGHSTRPVDLVGKWSIKFEALKGYGRYTWLGVMRRCRNES